MIANHDQFIQAIADKNKVWVRFYSKPDSGILEQAYTPLEYGLGNGLDGFNRYWLQDPAGGFEPRLPLSTETLVSFLKGRVFHFPSRLYPLMQLVLFANR